MNIVTIILILQGVCGSLRDEQPKNNNGASIDLTTENPLFKCKLNLVGNLVAGGGNDTKNRAKIAVSLKYLSNF